MFRVGNKVTQLRNNYDKGAAGVFNGTTGVVTGMSLEDHSLTVRTDQDEELASTSTNWTSSRTRTRSRSTGRRGLSTRPS